MNAVVKDKKVVEFETYITKKKHFKARKIKAKKIIAILKKFKNLKDSTVLDVGVGSGIITSKLAKCCKKVIGVDIIDVRKDTEGYQFKKVNDTLLPFRNDSFDIVVSNHVLEHVDNQQEHINEIYRVLKKDGICYLTTPNKFWIKEPHYKLLFLSLLPKRSADFYLKIFRKNVSYDIKLLSYNQILKLVSNKFLVQDFVFNIMNSPEEYYLEKRLRILSKIIPKFKFLKYILPSYIFILTKKN